MSGTVEKCIVVCTMFLVLSSVMSCSDRPREPELGKVTGIVFTLDQAQRLTQKARKGDARACWCLSLYYLEEEGDERLYWLRRGAELGNDEAQMALYETLKIHSLFLPDEALGWLRKAAAQGNVSAQRELGHLSRTGRYVKRNAKEAEYWYIRAARQGNDGAILDLSTFLAETAKGQRDLVNAYSWTIVALSRIEKKSGFVRLFMDLQQVILKKAAELGYERESLLQDARSQAMVDGKLINPETQSQSMSWGECRKLAAQ